MVQASLPPGFRFHPTDVELVMYYLKRKVMGKPFHFEAISELDIYKFAPWDLREKACLQSRDLEWYFLCPKDRKYASGSRVNRATEFGYWKTSGKDRPVTYNSQTVAMKRTLVFHRGRAPHVDRTDWLMYEYRLDNKYMVSSGISQDSYVLCKIFEKSGPGPKNGAQYGAPFKEEEWDDDMVNHHVESPPPIDPGIPSLILVNGKKMPVGNSMLVSESTCQTSVDPFHCLDGLSTAGKEHLPFPEGCDIETMLESFGDEDALLLNNTDESLKQDLLTQGSCAIESSHRLDEVEMFSGLDDIANGVELNTIDQFHFPINEDIEYAWGQTFMGDDASFLELNDLEYTLQLPVVHQADK